MPLSLKEKLMQKISSVEYWKYLFQDSNVHNFLMGEVGGVAPSSALSAMFYDIHCDIAQ